MKAREIRKLERARAHREVKEYSQRINRAFSRLSEECSNKVIRATSLEFPRDYVAGESGQCLPEIALFAAGHRKSKGEITAR